MVEMSVVRKGLSPFRKWKWMHSSAPQPPVASSIT